MPVDPDELVHSDIIRRVRNRRIPHVEVPGVTLFCGAPQPLTAVDFDPQRPWSVQFLPIEAAPPPTKRSRPSPEKSNGCGATVHTAGVPKRAGTMWRGSRPGLSDVVLPLEDKYVPRALKSVMKTRREGCGCLRSPVGCAVCGNPLGALIVHCPVHTHSESPSCMYEFAPSAVSPPLPAESASRTVPPVAARTYTGRPWQLAERRLPTTPPHSAGDDAATTRAARVGRASRPITLGTWDSHDEETLAELDAEADRAYMQFRRSTAANTVVAAELPPNTSYTDFIARHTELWAGTEREPSPSWPLPRRDPPRRTEWRDVPVGGGGDGAVGFDVNSALDQYMMSRDPDEGPPAASDILAAIRRATGAVSAPSNADARSDVADT
ncbi:hypothetical protein C8R44DRAFT_856130 [Mycena epipterygia]|nr:hypothetical protein C8R44DRAFT_856130 [Mycena epipterygia]